MDRDGTGRDAGRHQRPRPEADRRRAPADWAGHHRLAAATTAAPVVSLDVHRDPRFAWIRGVDQARFTSMCSVPLIWNDAGRRRAQRPDRRAGATSRRPTSASSRRSPGCSPGIVEKSRLQHEAEAQIESLRAIDEARANLVAVVTHALRTPLAVVRAYVELLGGRSQATRAARRRGLGATRRWRQVDRLDRTVDSILESLRVLPDREPPSLGPVDLAAVVDEAARELAPMLRRHSSWRHLPRAAADGAGLGRDAAPAARLPARERLQVRAGRRAASTSTAGARAIARSSPSPTTGRASRPSGASGSSSRSSGWTTRRAGRGHRAVRGAPPGALDGRRAAASSRASRRLPVRAGARSSWGLPARRCGPPDGRGPRSPCLAGLGMECGAAPMEDVRAETRERVDADLSRALAVARWTRRQAGPRPVSVAGALRPPRRTGR